MLDVDPVLRWLYGVKPRRKRKRREKDSAAPEISQERDKETPPVTEIRFKRSPSLDSAFSDDLFDDSPGLNQLMPQYRTAKQKDQDDGHFDHLLEIMGEEVDGAGVAQSLQNMLSWGSDPDKRPPLATEIVPTDEYEAIYEKKQARQTRLDPVLSKQLQHRRFTQRLLESKSYSSESDPFDGMGDLTPESTSVDTNSKDKNQARQSRDPPAVISTTLDSLFKEDDGSEDALLMGNTEDVFNALIHKISRDFESPPSSKVHNLPIISTTDLATPVSPSVVTESFPVDSERRGRRLPSPERNGFTTQATKIDLARDCRRPSLERNDSTAIQARMNGSARSRRRPSPERNASPSPERRNYNSDMKAPVQTSTLQASANTSIAVHETHQETRCNNKKYKSMLDITDLNSLNLRTRNSTLVGGPALKSQSVKMRERRRSAGHSPERRNETKKYKSALDLSDTDSDSGVLGKNSNAKQKNLLEQTAIGKDTRGRATHVPEKQGKRDFASMPNVNETGIKSNDLQRTLWSPDLLMDSLLASVRMSLQQGKTVNVGEKEYDSPRDRLPPAGSSPIASTTTPERRSPDTCVSASPAPFPEMQRTSDRRRPPLEKTLEILESDARTGTPSLGAVIHKAETRQNAQVQALTSGTPLQHSTVQSERRWGDASKQDGMVELAGIDILTVPPSQPHLDANSSLGRERDPLPIGLITDRDSEEAEIEIVFVEETFGQNDIFTPRGTKGIVFDCPTTEGTPSAKPIPWWQRASWAIPTAKQENTVPVKAGNALRQENVGSSVHYGSFDRYPGGDGSTIDPMIEIMTCADDSSAEYQTRLNRLTTMGLSSIRRQPCQDTRQEQDSTLWAPSLSSLESATVGLVKKSVSHHFSAMPPVSAASTLLEVDSRTTSEDPRNNGAVNPRTAAPDAAKTVSAGGYGRANHHSTLPVSLTSSIPETVQCTAVADNGSRTRRHSDVAVCIDSTNQEDMPKPIVSHTVHLRSPLLDAVQYTADIENGSRKAFHPGIPVSVAPTFPESVSHPFRSCTSNKEGNIDCGRPIPGEVTVDGDASNGSSNVTGNDSQPATASVSEDTSFKEPLSRAVGNQKVDSDPNLPSCIDTTLVEGSQLSVLQESAAVEIPSDTDGRNLSDLRESIALARARVGQRLLSLKLKRGLPVETIQKRCLDAKQLEQDILSKTRLISDRSNVVLFQPKINIYQDCRLPGSTSNDSFPISNKKVVIDKSVHAEATIELHASLKANRASNTTESDDNNGSNTARSSPRKNRAHRAQPQRAADDTKLLRTSSFSSSAITSPDESVSGAGSNSDDDLQGLVLSEQLLRQELKLTQKWTKARRRLLRASQKIRPKNRETEVGPNKTETDEVGLEHEAPQRSMSNTCTDQSEYSQFSDFRSEPDPDRKNPDKLNNGEASHLDSAEEEVLPDLGLRERKDESHYDLHQLGSGSGRSHCRVTFSQDIQTDASSYSIYTALSPQVIRFGDSYVSEPWQSMSTDGSQGGLYSSGSNFTRQGHEHARTGSFAEKGQDDVVILHQSGGEIIELVPLVDLSARESFEHEEIEIVFVDDNLTNDDADSHGSIADLWRSTSADESRTGICCSASSFTCPKHLVENQPNSGRDYELRVVSAEEEQEDYVILHHSSDVQALELASTGDLTALKSFDPEEVEIVFVEECFMKGDGFSYGDPKGMVFDWLSSEAREINGRQKVDSIETEIISLLHVESEETSSVRPSRGNSEEKRIASRRSDSFYAPIASNYAGRIPLASSSRVLPNAFTFNDIREESTGVEDCELLFTIDGAQDQIMRLPRDAQSANESTTDNAHASCALYDAHSSGSRIPVEAKNITAGATTTDQFSRRSDPPGSLAQKMYNLSARATSKWNGPAADILLPSLSPPTRSGAQYGNAVLDEDAEVATLDSRDEINESVRDCPSPKDKPLIGSELTWKQVEALYAGLKLKLNDTDTAPKDPRITVPSATSHPAFQRRLDACLKTARVDKETGVDRRRIPVPNGRKLQLFIANRASSSSSESTDSRAVVRGQESLLPNSAPDNIQSSAPRHRKTGTHQHYYRDDESALSSSISELGDFDAVQHIDTAREENNNAESNSSSDGYYLSSVESTEIVFYDSEEEEMPLFEYSESIGTSEASEIHFPSSLANLFPPRLPPNLSLDLRGSQSLFRTSSFGKDLKPVELKSTEKAPLVRDRRTISSRSQARLREIREGKRHRNELLKTPIAQQTQSRRHLVLRHRNRIRRHRRIADSLDQDSAARSEPWYDGARGNELSPVPERTAKTYGSTGEFEEEQDAALELHVEMDDASAYWTE